MSNPKKIKKIKEEDLKIFKTIKEMIESLEESFEERSVSFDMINKYSTLLKNIKETNKVSTLKEVERFKVFIEENKEAIKAKDITKFSNYTIKYSENVYLDFQSIFSIATQDEQNTIHSYLTTLLYQYSSGDEKKNLKKLFQPVPLPSTSSSASSSSSFGKSTKTFDGEPDLAKIIDETMNSMNNIDMKNPMDAISGILASGVIGKIFSCISTDGGEVDATKMLKTVTGLTSSLTSSMSEDSIQEIERVKKDMIQQIQPAVETELNKKKDEEKKNNKLDEMD